MFEFDEDDFAVLKSINRKLGTLKVPAGQAATVMQVSALLAEDRYIDREAIQALDRRFNESLQELRRLDSLYDSSFEDASMIQAKESTMQYIYRLLDVCEAAAYNCDLRCLVNNASKIRMAMDEMPNFVDQEYAENEIYQIKDTVYNRIEIKIEDIRIESSRHTLLSAVAVVSRD